MDTQMTSKPAPATMPNSMSHADRVNNRLSIPSNPHELVKQCLALAMLDLMQNKSFEDITITELTKKAGVSRMAYYRNFENKLEIIIDYMHNIDQHLPAYDLQQADEATVHQFLIELFEFIYQFATPTKTLVSQGLGHLILDTFNRSKFTETPETKNSVKAQYQSIFSTGMLYNTYIHWVMTGQQESPEQLAGWLMQSGFYQLINP